MTLSLALNYSCLSPNFPGNNLIIQSSRTAPGWVAVPRAGAGLSHVCWNRLSFKAKSSLSAQDLGVLPGQPRPPGASTLLCLNVHPPAPCPVSPWSACACSCALDTASVVSPPGHTPQSMWLHFSSHSVLRFQTLPEYLPVSLEQRSRLISLAFETLKPWPVGSATFPSCSPLTELLEGVDYCCLHPDTCTADLRVLFSCG